MRSYFKGGSISLFLRAFQNSKGLKNIIDLYDIRKHGIELLSDFIVCEQ